MYPCLLTDSDWNHLPTRLPNLDRATCRKTDEANEDYNCVAWAFGIIDDWIDPPDPRPEFLSLCMLFSLCRTLAKTEGLTHVGKTPGLRQCEPNDPELTVRWYRTPTESTHADLYNSNHSSWESKMGVGIRMLHSANGLEDKSPTETSEFGNVTHHFCPTSHDPATIKPEAMSVKANSDMQQTLVLRVQSLNSAFPGIEETFRHLFDGWKQIWFSGSRSHSQR